MMPQSVEVNCSVCGVSFVRSDARRRRCDDCTKQKGKKRIKSGGAKSGGAKSGGAKSGSAKSGSAKSGSAKSGNTKSAKKSQKAKPVRSNGHSLYETPFSMSDSRPEPNPHISDNNAIWYDIVRDDPELWKQGEVFVDILRYDGDSREWKQYLRWLSLAPLVEVYDTFPPGRYHFQVKQRKSAGKAKVLKEIRDITVCEKPQPSSPPPPTNGHASPAYGYDVTANPVFQSMFGDVKERLRVAEERANDPDPRLDYILQELEASKQREKEAREENERLRRDFTATIESMNQQSFDYLGQKDQVIAHQSQQEGSAFAGALASLSNQIASLQQTTSKQMLQMQQDRHKDQMAAKEREVELQLAQLRSQNDASLQVSNQQIAGLSAQVEQLTNSVNTLKMQPVGGGGVASFGQFKQVATEIKELGGLVGLKDVGDEVQEEGGNFMKDVTEAIKVFRDGAPAENGAPDAHMQQQPSGGPQSWMVPVAPDPAMMGFHPQFNPGMAGQGWGMPAVAQQPAPPPAPVPMQPPPSTQQQVQQQQAQVQQQVHPQQQVQQQQVHPQAQNKQQSNAKLESALAEIKPHLSHLEGSVNTDAVEFAQVLHAFMTAQQIQQLRQLPRAKLVKGIAQMTKQGSALRYRRGEQWLEHVIQAL